MRQNNENTENEENDEENEHGDEVNNEENKGKPTNNTIIRTPSMQKIINNLPEGVNIKQMNKSSPKPHHG